MQRDKNITIDMGMDYVCDKLSGLGLCATIKSKRPNIVVCKKAVNSREVVIHVSSRSEQDPISLKDNLEDIQEDFWVVVTLLNHGEPQTYILSSDEVKQRVNQDGGGNWLETKDYAVEQFKERWGRIVDSS